MGLFFRGMSCGMGDAARAGCQNFTAELTKQVLKGERRFNCSCKASQLLEGYLRSMAILHVATKRGEFWMESGKLRKLWELQSMGFLDTMKWFDDLWYAWETNRIDQLFLISLAGILLLRSGQCRKELWEQREDHTRKASSKFGDSSCSLFEFAVIDIAWRYSGTDEPYLTFVPRAFKMQIFQSSQRNFPKQNHTIAILKSTSLCSLAYGLSRL